MAFLKAHLDTSLVYKYLYLYNKITEKIYRRFSPVFNGSNRLSSVAFPDDDGGAAARGIRLQPAQPDGVRRVDGLDGPAHLQPGRLGEVLLRDPPRRRDGDIHGELQKSAALPGAAGGARGRAGSA